MPQPKSRRSHEVQQSFNPFHLGIVPGLHTAVPSMSAVSTCQSCNAQEAATITSTFETDQQIQCYYSAKEDSSATSTNTLYKAIFKDDKMNEPTSTE